MEDNGDTRELHGNVSKVVLGSWLLTKYNGKKIGTLYRSCEVIKFLERE